MKAILCRNYGPPESLEYVDIPAEKPGKGQVLIEVHNAGVNFPDTLVIEGKDQYKPALPFSPGGEIAGMVKETGPGVDGFNIGDRVFAGTVWGGYREQVVARANNTHKMPDSMDYLTASVFIAAYGTAIHCLLDRARYQKGETVAILGASGGVGTAIIQVAKALGARVIACASTPEKLAFCKANGADEIVNYNEQDLKTSLKALTNGKGVDILCDPVGSDYSEPALRATSWRGRYMVLGFTAGSIARIPLNLPLLKGNSIVGVFWSTFARLHPDENRKNVTQLLALYEKGLLQPRVHQTFSLENAKMALFGVFRSGDLGLIDESGLLYVRGRLDAVINVGGAKVSPEEVQAVLEGVPSVIEAHVMGIPDPESQEVVVAAVVDPEGQVTEAELLHRCRERMADYKVPRRILVVRDLPRGPTGKARLEPEDFLQ